MAKNSLVSIIISDLETNPSLPRLLQSVARQSTGLDLTEVLIAGSGGHASSAPSMWSAITGINSIRLIEIDNTATPALARNNAATLANGDFLLFLRPDYRLDPKYMTTAFSVFADNPEADIMYTDYIRLSPEKNSSFKPGLVQLPHFDDPLLQTRNILGPAVMLRRSAWDQLQGFRDNTTYREWDLWIQAATAGCYFYHVDYPLASCEHAKVSFRERAEDGRCKAMLVINNQGYFHMHTVRWALSYLRGEQWAQAHGFMTIPNPMEVTRMMHEFTMRQMGTDSLAQMAIRQFDSSPHTIEAIR